MKKIVTVVGARPQFIKAAAISRVIGNRHAGELQEVLIHTGQHYDENMSAVFFRELGIPTPDYNLGISGGGHGVMTGRMLEGIEKVLIVEKPDWLLTYGDTNSTLAGALAAAKLHIPIAHVEAGLRSFNMRMPEEVNRVLVDRLSSLLFCPTATAMENLRNEGITKGCYNVGDVMYDVALFYAKRAERESRILGVLNVKNGGFVLATCHRAENTDDPERLGGILDALNDVARQQPVILPLHPRTCELISKYGFSGRVNALTIIEPLSYLDMVALERAASVICTDSGGIQKEAFFYGVPCVTLRDETEWVELVELGWNKLAGADRYTICKSVESASSWPREYASPYGAGEAAQKIVQRVLVS